MKKWASRLLIFVISFSIKIEAAEQSFYFGQDGKKLQQMAFDGDFITVDSDGNSTFDEKKAKEEAHKFNLDTDSFIKTLESRTKSKIAFDATDFRDGKERLHEMAREGRFIGTTVDGLPDFDRLKAKEAARKFDLDNDDFIAGLKFLTERRILVNQTLARQKAEQELEKEGWQTISKKEWNKAKTDAARSGSQGEDQSSWWGNVFDGSWWHTMFGDE